MTKNKKNTQNITYASIMKAPFSYKTFNQGFSYKKTTIYTITLLLILSVISILKNNIENYSLISNTQVFLYSTLGLITIFFIIPFTIFYTFLNAYETKKLNYIKGLLITTITFLPFLILGNLTDYIAQLLAIPALAIFSIFIIFIIMTYSAITFIFTITNFYNTTPSKTITSMILTFLTFTMILMSGYIMQLISIMR